MTENKGPVFKTRSGRFQVSIWRQDRVVPGRSDWGAERDVIMYRACIQHSKWNPMTREWENQNIWCSVDDLRSLVNALDELNGAPGIEIPATPDAVSVGPRV
jgi:hypothetical protein